MNRVVTCGIYLNKNTLESFKACDKKELLKTQGDELMQNIQSGTVFENPTLLAPFVVLTFAVSK